MERDIHDRLDRARAITRENIENMQRAATELQQSAKALGARALSATTEAGKKMGDVRVQAGRAAGQANRLITEHPLAAVAAAVAIGAMAAHLFGKARRPAEPEEAASNESPTEAKE